MTIETRTMLVKRIDNQGDRVLLYSTEKQNSDGDYHVIASKNCTVKIGDIIRYEPYGGNFGWHIKEVQS